MTHLSDAELTDAAAHALAPARRAHLETCDRCRAAATGLESTLREVSAVDVPEPSPLFWDHFSARVHDAVAAEPAASRWVWASLRAPWIQVAGFCVLVIAIVSAAWLVRPAADHTSDITLASATDPHPAPATPSALREVADTEAANDPAWIVLSAAAADVTPDMSDAQAPSSPLTVRPAAIDTAVQELTPQERQELQRLLQSEMKRSSD